LNIRLEKERAFAQIETIGPLQNRLVTLHAHPRIAEDLSQRVSDQWPGQGGEAQEERKQDSSDRRRRFP
jgi:hypothetical protein